jgi:Tetratricopeptide repeat
MGWAQRAAQTMVPEPDQALRQSQDVLSWSIRKNGPDAPISIKAMVEVANQLAGHDRLLEELEMREKIVVALGRQFGPEHEATLSAELKLATCLTTLDRPEDAEVLLEHVVEGRTRDLGRSDPQTLAALAWSSNVSKKLGRLNDARDLQERVVSGYGEQGAGESDQALLAELHLASTLTDLHDLRGASLLLRHVLHVRQRVLGADDPKTLDVLRFLDSIGADGEAG